MEIQNERRKKVKEQLGHDQIETIVEKAIEKEQQRRERKQLRRVEIQKSTSYQLTVLITYMDRYYIDPALGLLLPVLGDMLPSILVMPFLYVSLVKIKSIPLSLAVLYNVLVDTLVGLVPLLGAIFDVFHRSHIKNSKLITGFVNDDRKIIGEVNKKAVGMGFLIFVVGYLIYLMFILVQKVYLMLGDFFSRLYEWGVALLT